jgi:hypothetical protein
MPRKPIALDKMVDFLAGEDEYWCRIVNNPRLWGDKKRDATASQVRHQDKRRRLSNYRQCNENTVHESIIDLVNLPTREARVDDIFSDDIKSPLRTEISTEEIIEQLGFISPDVAAKLTGKDCTTPFSTTSTVAKDESTRKQLCPGCKRAKIINKYCKLHVCKSCCCESTAECTLTDHKRSKKIGAAKPYEQTSLANSVLPGLLEKVQSAISAKESLYILYGGTRSDQLRKIDPKQLTQGKEGKLLESYCHLAKDVRHFYLYKIKRIEDHDWVPPGTFYIFCVAFIFPYLISIFGVFSNQLSSKFAKRYYSLAHFCQSMEHFHRAYSRYFYFFCFVTHNLQHRPCPPCLPAWKNFSSN